MWLSDLLQLSNNKKGSSTEKITNDSVKTELINRQIKALSPGQTISGEIISRNGNEVQLRLPDDLVLTARVDKNIHLELGRGMTFEVKNNGSSLTLSPLFANTATDATVLKALNMASLPVNDTTVVLTQSMMNAGMSIQRNALQQMFRELGSFPQASVEDIIDLHRLGMEVNQENLEQLASYKNMTYQLMEGMNQIWERMPETIQTIIQEGTVENAAEIYQALLDITEGLQAGEGLGILEEANITDITLLQPNIENEQQNIDGQKIGLQEETAKEISAAKEGKEAMQEILLSKGQEQVQNANTETLLNMTLGLTEEEAVLEGLEGEQKILQTLSLSERNDLAGQMQELLDNLSLSVQQYQQLQEAITAMADGKLADGEIQRLISTLLQQGITSSDGKEALSKLLTNKSLMGVLTRSLQASWTLRPQDMKEPKQLEELYNRLNRQLHTLSDALEQAGMSHSSMSKTVSGMTQNIDFLQQINQMYTYVQLPLKMGQNATHGDLYVYSNKKNLASKDGKISALLHLDMEHLGPIDVYVAMQNSQVSTNFYVKDDEMLDFLMAHIDLLNKRLQQRGYQMKCEMKIREGDKPQPIIQTILQDTNAGNRFVQYAFDVRA